MCVQLIIIPKITLQWTKWYNWNEFISDCRTCRDALNPPKDPGVYEVFILEEHRCLTIGKANNLRYRIKTCLVKGTGKHSSGKRFRANENTNSIYIRWALTSRPSAVEEELHRIYKLNHQGKLPEYTEFT